MQILTGNNGDPLTQTLSANRTLAGRDLRRARLPRLRRAERLPDVFSSPTGLG